MAFEELGPENIWKPEEDGDQITGEVIDLGQTEWEDGKTSDYIVITSEEDNNDYKTPAHTTLERLIKRVNIGDRIRITFIGMDVSKNGNNFFNYKLEVDR